MKIIDEIKPGSTEWATLATASKAPAMMGDSKFKTRNQLLGEMATGVRPEVSPSMQRLFDEGHRAENAARDTLELELMEDFPALTGEREVEGMRLVANFDGYCENLREVWEHKLWKESLAEDVRNGVELIAEYYWQLEHQLLVAGESAVKARFTVSDGGINKREWVFYHSVPERREKLIRGWKRFFDDLKNYTPAPKHEQLNGAEADGYPLVEYEVRGTEIQSNIRAILPIVKERAAEEMQRKLETDQDFADKEKQIKAVKAARRDLKAKVEEAQAEFVSFSEFSDMAKDMDSVLQKLQSHGEKVVKEAKEDKKTVIWQLAQDNYTAFLEAEREKIGVPDMAVSTKPDFRGAMKNKKTLASIQDAVDEELNRAKIDAESEFVAAEINLKVLKSEHAGRMVLFPDLKTVITLSPDEFAEVAQRVVDWEKSEKERLEREEAIEGRRRAMEKEREEEEAERKAKGEERLQGEVVHRGKEEHKQEGRTPAEATRPVKRSEKLERDLGLVDDIEAWSQKHKVDPDAIKELFEIIRAHYVREAA